VKPTPPVRRFADSVRATVHLLARCGMSETRAALELARAGWRVSERSVARIRRAFRPPPTPTPPAPASPRRPVIARFVHHTWMMDVTQIRSLLGSQTFFLTGVFDAFSRMPLALSLSSLHPQACDTARLLRSAAKLFRAPKYVITDLGGEFTGLTFLRTVQRLGATPRFASAENIYATARLERFWRTLKDSASLRFLRPLTLGDLERRLEPALTHYLAFRAHQGLRGATPLEAFLGAEPSSAKATSPPRGRPGEGPRDSPFTVDYLDPLTRSLPVLRAAA
jgi:transposase InsO family protein